MPRRAGLRDQSSGHRSTQTVQTRQMPWPEQTPLLSVSTHPRGETRKYFSQLEKYLTLITCDNVLQSMIVEEESAEEFTEL